MDRRRRKWVVLAAIGTSAGLVTLSLFRSIPIAAGTAAALIVALIVLKHLALAMIVGSPLAALFQSIKFQNIKLKIRAHCPFAKH